MSPFSSPVLLVRKKYENIQKLIHEIQLDRNLHSKFTWKDNQLRYKGRLWLGDQSKIKKDDIARSSWWSRGWTFGGEENIRKSIESLLLEEDEKRSL